MSPAGPENMANIGARGVGFAEETGRRVIGMKGIPVGLGTADFGTAVSLENAFRVLDKYASLGGRVIDTANMYACWHPLGQGGESEVVIGRWLEQQDRSAFTIMTKIGSQPVKAKDGSSHREGLSSEAVHRAVDQSLARLNTDVIDILLAHHDDGTSPLRDTWQAFSDLVVSGKVKQIGVSNYSPKRITELARIVREHVLVPVDYIQLKYSVIAPEAGTDLEKLVLLDSEMAETLARVFPSAVIFAYSPLLGGAVFEATTDVRWPSGYESLENRRKIKEIQRAARKLGVSPSAYVLKQISDQGLWPITATGNAERLEANLKLF